MSMSPFLREVLDGYKAKHKRSGDRESLEQDLIALRARVAQLESDLAVMSDDSEMADFLEKGAALFGDNATAATLTNMLVAKFGGAVEPPAKKRTRRSKSANAEGSEGAEADEVGDTEDSEVTEAEKDLILAQLTRESMSVNEVAAATSQSTHNKWEPADISPILRALVKDGKVITEGERRGKRYMLPA